MFVYFYRPQIKLVLRERSVLLKHIHIESGRMAVKKNEERNVIELFLGVLFIAIACLSVTSQPADGQDFERRISKLTALFRP